MFSDCGSLRTQDTREHCYRYERLQERTRHWMASPTFLGQTLWESYQNPKCLLADSEQSQQRVVSSTFLQCSHQNSTGDDGINLWEETLWWLAPFVKALRHHQNEFALIFFTMALKEMSQFYKLLNWLISFFQDKFY